MLPRRWSFNIGCIGSIHWSLMKTREVDVNVMGAGNQYMVLATVVKNAEGGTFIINHVRNYPLGCTIPHTQIILLFYSTYIHIMTTKKSMTNLAIATSAEQLVMNIVIVVTVANSTFTSDVLLHHSPSKLKSMTTNWPAFGSWWSSLATSVAKKAICPTFMPNAISLYIHVVLLAHADWKFTVTTTVSTSPLLLKSVNLTLQFVDSVFEKWIQSSFTIAQDAILLPTSVVLCSPITGST